MRCRPGPPKNQRRTHFLPHTLAHGAPFVVRGRGCIVRLNRSLHYLDIDLNLDFDPLPIKPSLDNSISSFVRHGSSSKSFAGGRLGRDWQGLPSTIGRVKWNGGEGRGGERAVWREWKDLQVGMFLPLAHQSLRA